MHISEVPLRHVRGKTLVYNARAYHMGQGADLTPHRIRFAIADRDDMTRLVTVETGSGITQDEKGNFEVMVPASRLRRNTLPESEYWYEIELWEDGDTDKRFTLQQGPLFMEGSPFE